MDFSYDTAGTNAAFMPHNTHINLSCSLHSNILTRFGTGWNKASANTSRSFYEEILGWSGMRYITSEVHANSLQTENGKKLWQDLQELYVSSKIHSVVTNSHWFLHNTGNMGEERVIAKKKRGEEKQLLHVDNSQLCVLVRPRNLFRSGTQPILMLQYKC